MSEKTTWEESGKNGGSGYYRRLKGSYVWEFVSWKSLPLMQRPKNRAAAIEMLDGWNLSEEWEYALVQCSVCHEFHNGTSDWVGDRCTECKNKKLLPICILAGDRQQFINWCKEHGENPYQTKEYVDGNSAGVVGFHFRDIVCIGTFESRPDAATQLEYAKAHLVEGTVIQATGKGPKPLLMIKPGTLVPTPKPAPMKNGAVRRLPKANSPMWTQQWAAQGTAKLPYVVSKKAEPNGATTDEGWACSCNSFTQNKPRADCKHICWVKKFENLPMTSSVSLLPKEQQEAFKKFLLQQAQAGNPATKSEGSKPFITQGRRFR